MRRDVESPPVASAWAIAGALALIVTGLCALVYEASKFVGWWVA